MAARVGFRSPYDILAAAKLVNGLMNSRFADAEQAKQTGGMIALFPRVDEANKLLVPGGEPLEDLHVTLAYLGEQVSEQDPRSVMAALGQVADHTTVITARIMGHATFNPDNGPEGDKDPCAVYLISDSEQLPDLHHDVLDLATKLIDLPQQHKPWIPHITAGYNLDSTKLTYTGPILFDRIGYAYMGHTHFFPLVGSNAQESDSNTYRDQRTTGS